MQNKVLGFDFAGVLMETLVSGSKKLWQSEKYIRTEEVDSAFEILHRLGTWPLDIPCHLIAACNAVEEIRIREWLEHHNFSVVTGVPPANIHFCRRIAEISGICQGVGVTHYISHRLEILGTIIGSSVTNVLFFEQREPHLVADVERFPHYFQYTTAQPRNWMQVEANLTSHQADAVSVH